MNRRRVKFSQLRDRRARGMIFVVTLGIIVILSGMVLVFAQNMRTEAVASANRLAYAKSDAIEQGAEKWVMAQVDNASGNAATVCSTAAEAVAVGDGYFWILRPNVDDDTQYDFGITDESSKININSALQPQLLALTALPEDAADAIRDWHDPTYQSSASSYYPSLADSYESKEGNFETVEELLLVEGITPEILYGVDRNRDGVITDDERNASNAGAMFGSDESSVRGLMPYLTCYTSQPAGASLNINGNVTADSTKAFATMCTNAGLGSRATALSNAWAMARQSRGRRGFLGPEDFRTSVMPNVAEFKLIAGKWSVGAAATAAVGKISPGSASRSVLISLGLEESDADRLITYRRSADLSTLSWLFDAGVDVTKITNALTNMTSTSFQYSADIVAVSGDGRSFKRVRIVVDGTATPSKIIYRKELTDLGWPLPPEIRTSMRSGKGVVTGFSSTSSVNTSSSGGSHLSF